MISKRKIQYDISDEAAKLFLIWKETYQKFAETTWDFSII